MRLAALLGHAGRAAERRAVRTAAEAGWLRINVVAARHARHAVAREQEQVEGGRGEADEALDAAPVGELGRGPVGHERRL